MSAPAVLFADLGAHLASRLTALLAPRYTGRNAVVVATVEPTTRPARLVTLRRDGGPRRDVASEVARIGVNVWGANDADATTLANMVRALLPTLVDGNPVCQITEASGLIDVTPASGQARRYFSLEVVARGQQL